MIVDIDTVPRTQAIARIAELEAELFDAGAWSAAAVAQELAAPARTYLLDIMPGNQTDATPHTPTDATAATLAATAASTADTQTASATDTQMTFTADTETSSATDTETPPEIRGYAGFWYDGDDAELMTIGVGAAYQRQGIATALLDALIDRAREQGARRMLLEVRVDNEPALTLYLNAGFERIGLRKRYYQPGNIDAYTMALDLAPRVVGFTPTNPTEPAATEGGR